MKSGWKKKHRLKKKIKHESIWVVIIDIVTVIRASVSDWNTTVEEVFLIFLECFVGIRHDSHDWREKSQSVWAKPGFSAEPGAVLRPSLRAWESFF